MSEKETRNKLIDASLRSSGWTNIVDFEEVKRYDFAAVREYETDNGPADYVLFHNGRALAAIEAKKLSLGPQNVLVQAERYAKGFRGELVPQDPNDAPASVLLERIKVQREKGLQNKTNKK